MGEILKFHSNEEELVTSESAKNWTETSWESKLTEINTVLDENEELNKIQELKSLIANREYKKFQREICMDINKCNWKLWQETLDFLSIFIETEKEKAKNWLNNRVELDQLMLEVGTENMQNLLDTSKITHSENIHLSRFQTLNDEEYNEIFSWKEEICQWQIEDCYLVSWINELTQTNYFDTLMKTSISREEFEDNSLWYCIKIPLWEPNGRKIYIKDSEISNAKIKWNIWYKLLEIAYAKNKRPNNKAWNTYDPVTDRDFKNIEYGWTHEVLQTFLWYNNIWFNDFGTRYSHDYWHTLSSLWRRTKEQIKNSLKNFEWTIWNKFVSLWTTWVEWWSSVPFTVWEHTLFHAHAYSVSSVELDANWELQYINIKNPRNNKSIIWWGTMKLTFDEFCKAFSFVWIWTIKVDSFLNTRPTTKKSRRDSAL